jgi:hypothetical protein
MLPPLPRCSGSAYSSLFSPGRVSLPRKSRRVGLHIVLFEACSAFTRVAACTLARPPIRGPLYRRLQPFRLLHDCSSCFRLEQLPGGTFTHWKAPPFHGAHPIRTLATANGLWRDLCPAQSDQGFVDITSPYSRCSCAMTSRTGREAFTSIAQVPSTPWLMVFNQSARMPVRPARPE